MLVMTCASQSLVMYSATNTSPLGRGGTPSPTGPPAPTPPPPCRTLPLYEELRALKAHCLAEPDVLICGVGTRIYHRTAAGGAWLAGLLGWWQQGEQCSGCMQRPTFGCFCSDTHDTRITHT
jgi:hypothetical protein